MRRARQLLHRAANEAADTGAPHIKAGVRSTGHAMARALPGQAATTPTPTPAAPRCPPATTAPSPCLAPVRNRASSAIPAGCALAPASPHLRERGHAQADALPVVVGVDAQVALQNGLLDVAQAGAVKGRDHERGCVRHRDLSHALQGDGHVELHHLHNKRCATGMIVCECDMS